MQKLGSKRCEAGCTNKVSIGLGSVVLIRSIAVWGSRVKKRSRQAAFDAVEGLFFVRRVQEAGNLDIWWYFYTFVQPAAIGPERPFMATVRVDMRAAVEMARQGFDRIMCDMP
ncbi:MAG: hypothetical protein KGL39_13805 [Patescibacteria group bacterium]|nr:hypothetical protein [Patescibacteria group bacterium]